MNDRLKRCDQEPPVGGRRVQKSRRLIGVKEKTLLTMSDIISSIVTPAFAPGEVIITGAPVPKDALGFPPKLQSKGAIAIEFALSDKKH